MTSSALRRLLKLLDRTVGVVSRCDGAIGVEPPAHHSSTRIVRIPKNRCECIEVGIWDVIGKIYPCDVEPAREATRHILVVGTIRWPSVVADVDWSRHWRR